MQTARWIANPGEVFAATPVSAQTWCQPERMGRYRENNKDTARVLPSAAVRKLQVN